jgi:hypothetical protein
MHQYCINIGTAFRLNVANGHGGLISIFGGCHTRNRVILVFQLKSLHAPQPRRLPIAGG